MKCEQQQFICVLKVFSAHFVWKVQCVFCKRTCPVVKFVDLKARKNQTTSEINERVQQPRRKARRKGVSLFMRYDMAAQMYEWMPEVSLGACVCLFKYVLWNALFWYVCRNKARLIKNLSFFFRSNFLWVSSCINGMLLKFLCKLLLKIIWHKLPLRRQSKAVK